MAILETSEQVGAPASDAVTDGQPSMPSGGDAMTVSDGPDSPTAMPAIDRLGSGESVDWDCALFREAVALSLSELAPSQDGLDPTPQAKQGTSTKKDIKSVAPTASPLKSKALRSSTVSTEMLCRVLCCVV